MQRLMLLSPKYADEIRGDSRLDFMKSNEKVSLAVGFVSDVRH